ncbi:hypothetical protein KUTeg_001477 [Tegillarca granosa]|uniref:Fibronectin type-III domain-containing protein n=1 Tax=Tegillarca granosa TaxID=220873 RepID=A0ABQ9FVX7_TEGGR|nr:hypothetical protein KUTeg_001477 [Tegillarca granosa]
MTQDRDSVTLQWKKPRYDGGSGIIGYILQQKDGKSGTWTKIKDIDKNTFNTRVKDLVPGKEYSFRIKAVNAVGESEPTEIEITNYTK